MSSLADSLKKLSNKPIAQDLPPESTPKVESKAAKADPPKSSARPSRKGKKLIGGHFDPTVSKQLKQLALDEDTTTQALLGQALNLLFESRQLPQIAETE